MSMSSSAVHASTSFFSRFSTTTDDPGRATPKLGRATADPSSTSSSAAELKREPNSFCASGALRSPSLTSGHVSAVEDSEACERESPSLSEVLRPPGADGPPRKSDSIVRISAAAGQ
eukprot:scaffold282341_cov26-Tisochrysis_lutea.AAC.4